MIAVSVIVAVVLSVMGKQIGNMTYAILNPSDDPVETKYEPVPKKPAVKPAPVKPVAIKSQPVSSKPTTSKPASSKVVKKSVPVQRPKNTAVNSSPPEKKARPGVKKKTIQLPNIIEMHESQNSAQSANPAWAIQTGVYTDKKYALEDTSKFAVYSPAAIILTCGSGKKIYAVRFGKFPNSTAAGRALSQFRRKEGIDAISVPLYGKQDLIRFCRN